MTPEPYYADAAVTLLAGDCLDVLPTLPDASVDAVVCDPPYGLEFMGKGWDAPWTESGINADAAFSRVAMSDGFTRLPRPSFTGSTNPTCRNCKGRQRGRRDGTAIVPVCMCRAPDFPNVRAVEMRAFGQWCEAWAVECLRVLKPGGHLLAFGGTRTYHRLACAVEDAGFEIRDSISWLYGSGFPKSLNVGEGRGTALKPAHEPIVVGRKSLVGTVAANVLAHGTGALNVDACRVGTDGGMTRHTRSDGPARDRWDGNSATGDVTLNGGRWPTNVLLDESQAAALDEQTGVLTSGILAEHHARAPKEAGILGAYGSADGERGYGDSGGASRFFPTFRYEAKAGSAERPSVDGVLHPTVKPLDLMRWLVRLVSPRGGIVLDPFLGSGTTAEACVIEGFRCIGIERETTYLPLIVARLAKPIETVLDFGESA